MLWYATCHSWLRDVLLILGQSKRFFEDMRRTCAEKNISIASHQAVQEYKSELLSRTPPLRSGLRDGVRFCVTDALAKLESTGEKLAQWNKKLQQRPWRVKLSADGMRDTRRGGLLFLTMTFVDADNPHSRDATIMIGVAQCCESYHNMGMLFDEVVPWLRKPDGFDKSKYDFYFSADLKMMRIVLGQDSCRATYHCTHCEAPRAGTLDCVFELADFDPANPSATLAPCCHYRRSAARTEYLHACRQQHRKSRTKFDCKSQPNAPLLCLPLEKFVLDVLHIGMRTLEKVVQQSAEYLLSESCDRRRKPGRKSNAELNTKAATLKCFSLALSDIFGRSIQLVEDRDRKVVRPSFTGNDVKQFCENAVPVLFSARYYTTLEGVTDLCQFFCFTFAGLYTASNLNTESGRRAVMADIQVFVHEYHTICSYVPLPASIHALLYHVPEFLKLYKDELYNFSQEGVEATVPFTRGFAAHATRNDLAKRLQSLMANENIRSSPQCLQDKQEQQQARICVTCHNSGHGNARNRECPKNKRVCRPGDVPPANDESPTEAAGMQAALA